jgi:hypothetical protein
MMLLNLTLAVALPARGQPERAVDLFIAERPGALTIYNRYQQEITEEERRLLLPYVPLAIVRADETLSDHFTRCMVVRLDQAAFYLLKDDRQRLVNAGSAGYTATLTGCAVLSDTLRVLAPVVAAKLPARAVLPDTLRPGTLVRRLYRKNGQDYVEALNAPAVYGWARFAAETRGSAWDTIDRKTALSPEKPAEALRETVERRLAEANAVLRDLFGLLNRQTGQNRPAPQWQTAVENGRIVCALSDRTYDGRFAESAQYMANDLDALVRAEGFTASYANGVIVIRRAP